MKRKLHRANGVVASKVVQIVKVVNVVDLGLVVLPLLEVVLHVETLDPCRAQVVHDYFRHANLLPRFSYLSVEHDHAVCARERVQVRKILARE